MAGRSPWKISALISACYEFVLAMFLLFQLVLALLVMELSKFLPVVRTCSCDTRRDHNVFCCGHFPPFSPCRERNARQSAGISGAAHTPTRFSRGVFPGRSFSEGLSTSRDEGDHVSPCEKAGFLNQARSLSMSSVYKRKTRHNSTASVEDNAPSTQGCKGSVSGEACRCSVSEIDLYDDLVQVSSEFLKQKDRGHEEVILSLLKSLQVERRNLRTLYEELEEERVASETAANETMAMILRLQEEKSALQMEAAHYQRMVEEKALHDEHAIQLLEEDLCQKESERLFLEEELNLLRERYFCDGMDGAESIGSASCCSTVIKPVLLLTGIDDVSHQEEDQEEECVVNLQDTAKQKNVSTSCILSKEFPDPVSSEDQPLKKLKSYTLLEKGNTKDLSASDHTEESLSIDTSKHSEKPELYSDEDDAKSILVQLSALEKQLLSLEESERSQPWHQAQVLDDHLMCKFSSSDGCSVRDENADVSMQGNTRASETVSIFDEERVVNVDVANVHDGSYRKVQVRAADDILEIHNGKRSKSKVVQWEAWEEEKHLDIPSFVPRSNSNTAIASTFEEACKPDVAQLPCPAMWEEEQWNAKRVTLEGINLRLQALENENTLLRHRSAPSNHDEHMSTVFLKEIMQELQELLKANKNVSATNEALNAYVKGT
eukprot:c25053_g1_i2 orf=665-2650(+)